MSRFCSRALSGASRSAFTAKLSLGGLEAAEDPMKEFKLIDKPVPWKEMVDQSPLPSELRVEQLT